MKKKVIFVGGTEFSGSTFFHMILANDPRGLAVGEAHNLMRPSRAYHFDMHCSCGDHPCTLWQELKAGGEKALYPTLFARFPEVDFIVDSSKDPFWIQHQKAYLRQHDIAARDILVWKSPYEFAKSHEKRGSMPRWERSWQIYHQMYNTLFDNWRAVPYQDLTSDRTVLQRVCDYLSITDFPGKERYWERSLHHVVGGNPSARVHLYAGDDENYQENVQRSSSKIAAAQDGTHRSIYYDADVAPELKAAVDERIQANSQLPLIYDLLQSRDVRIQNRDRAAEGALTAQVQMADYLIQMRRIKYRSVRGLAGLRYG